MGIIAIVLGGVWIAPVLLLGGGIFAWRVWGVSTTTTTSTSSQRKGGLGGWVILILILALAGALFHHASREWIWENVTKTWQTQVQGLHYLTYEISPDLSSGKTKECLEPGLYTYRGIKSASEIYQVTLPDGKVGTGYFQGGGYARDTTFVRGMPVENPTKVGVLLLTSSLNKNVVPGDVIVISGECTQLKISHNFPPKFFSTEFREGGSYLPLNAQDKTITIVLEEG